MTAAAAASASVSVGATAEQAAVSAAADVNDRLSGRSTASTVSPQTLTYIIFIIYDDLDLPQPPLPQQAQPWAMGSSMCERAPIWGDSSSIL